MGRKRTEKLARRAVAAEAQRMVSDQRPAERLAVAEELVRQGFVTVKQARRIVAGNRDERISLAQTRDPGRGDRPPEPSSPSVEWHPVSGPNLGIGGSDAE